MEKKILFWDYLDEEVIRASRAGAGFVLHFDGNLWAGENIIPGDPRQQNRNGKLFEEFLGRNPHLSVVNSLPLCEGLITRRRLRDGNLEESILDFYVVCDRVLPHIVRMEIDESKKYVLTNYEQVRKGGKAADTDHATQVMDVDLELLTEKPVRTELVNFKDKECQQIFKSVTSKTEDFTSCFSNDLPLVSQIENWRGVLDSYCGRSFKKIRIKKRRAVKAISPAISNLINKRNLLTQKGESQVKINDLNEIISDFEAKENRKIIMENFKHFSDNPESVNLSQMWKIVKKNSGQNVGQPCPQLKRTIGVKLFLAHVN